ITPTVIRMTPMTIAFCVASDFRIAMVAEFHIVEARSIRAESDIPVTHRNRTRPRARKPTNTVKTTARFVIVYSGNGLFQMHRLLVGPVRRTGPLRHRSRPADGTYFNIPG